MSNRLVVAQGPLQLLQAIAVLEELSEKDPSEGNDVLLLGGMGVDGAEKDALHDVCRRIAALWPFGRIEETPPDRMGCAPDEWASETSQLADRFRSCLPSQVLVCRNYQFVNEIALGAFPDAERLAYGDSLGVADVRPEGSASQNRPEGAFRMHGTFAVFPSLWEPEAWSHELPRMVDLHRVAGIFRRAAALFPELDAVVSRLEAIGASTLVLTGYLTEAHGLADPEAEIRALEDILVPHTRHGEFVVVKGHPRERHGQSFRLAAILRAAGREVFTLDSVRHIPVELLALLWKPSRAFTFTSSSAIPLAWLTGCDVHVGYGRKALSFMYQGTRLAELLVTEEILALQAREAQLGKPVPVVRHDNGEQGQFHHRPIRVTRCQAESAEGTGFPQRGLLVPVAPSTASRIRRLHLGSGHKRMFGYLDVDAYVHAQGILPVSHVELPHQTSSVDEILSEHSLEHIGKYEVPLALAEWARVLRPGGRLFMNLPNLEWCMKAWLSTPEEHRWGWQLDTIFGLQDHPGEYHKTGFTAPRLRQLLADAGFTQVRIDDYWSHGQGCFWVEAVRDDALRDPVEGRARQWLGLGDLDRSGFGPVDPATGAAMFGMEASFVVPAGRGTDQLRLRFDLELPSEGLEVGQVFEMDLHGERKTMRLDSSTPRGVVSLDVAAPRGDVRISIRCARPNSRVGELEIGGILGRLRILASSAADRQPVVIDPGLEDILLKSLLLHLGGDASAARRRFAPGVDLPGGLRLEKALLLLQAASPEAALWELDGLGSSLAIDLLRGLALGASGEVARAELLLGTLDVSSGLAARVAARVRVRLAAWSGDWSGVSSLLESFGGEWTTQDQILFALVHLVAGDVVGATEIVGTMDPATFGTDAARKWFDALLSTGRVLEARAWLESLMRSASENRFEWRIRALAMDAAETGGLQVEPFAELDEVSALLENAIEARRHGDPAEERRILLEVKEKQSTGSLLSRVVEARFATDAIRTAAREPLPAEPKVSIVIPAYDGVQLTRECVQSIRAVGARTSFEIVVVDDASTDDTLPMLRALRDEGKIVLVEHEKNAGFAASCNDGAKAATGDILVFLNNDTLARRGWLDALVDELLRDDSVGVVGSQLLFADGRIQHAGVAWKWSESHPYPEHIFRFERGDLPEARVVLDYPCVTGACLAVPSRLFAELEGFSERFGMYCEDADFCLRVWERGLRVRYAPTSRLVHLESATPIDMERRLEKSRKASAILYADWDGRWPSSFAAMPAWMWPRQARIRATLEEAPRGSDVPAAPSLFVERLAPLASPAILDVSSAIKGRIPIAMPAYNRDKYLKPVLDALRNCRDLDRFFIVTGEEPGCPATAALFDAVDWVPVIRGRNMERLGCNANVLGTLDRAFELADRAVSLEDDIVPAPDFLSFIRWGLDRFKDEPAFFDVCGYQRILQAPSRDMAGLVQQFDWFAPWGWATWRDRWTNFRREVHVPASSKESWDCFVCKWVVDVRHLKELRPAVGRVQNIGEEGTWVPSAEWQRENQQTPHWTGNLGWDPVPREGFHLEGEKSEMGIPHEVVKNVGGHNLSGVLAAVASGLRMRDRSRGPKTSAILAGSTAIAPSSSARILLDLRTLADPNSVSRGIGHYSLHLVRALLAKGGCHYGVLWDDRPGSERRPDLGAADIEWVAYSTFEPGAWDLVHVFDPMGNHPNYEDPFTLFGREQRLTTTFYDLIPWHFYRESMGCNWEVYLARLERLKASDATHLCISRFTAEDLMREQGIDPGRTAVVMAGLNANHEQGEGEKHDRFLIAAMGVDGPFCMYVGALDPHKNFEGALNAWRRARMEIPSLKLVVVGRRNLLLDEVEKQVKEHGLSDGVVFTGFIGRDQLEALYRRAVATLFLSRFEGFGFPVLEAMAASCPVICSNATSIPEVAGNAAVVCGPDDHEGAGQALVRLHSDPVFRETLIERGLRQSDSFTWDKVAAAVLACWEKELARPRRTIQVERQRRAFVEFFAPIYDPSGYAAEARPVIQELVASKIPVRTNPIGRTSWTFRQGCPEPIRNAISESLDLRSANGSSVQVVWFPGYAFRRNPSAAWNVGRTMFETDSLPENWIVPCNSMDEIWVPTDFNLETFRKAGVTVPLLKIPGGVDTAIYRPGLEPLPLPGRPAGTTYLSVFEWTARKGFDVLLKGWARTFKPSDDVRLVLRAYPPNAIEGDPTAWVDEQIDRFLASIGTSRSACAQIVVIASQVAESDMPRLYAAADVYLAPSRGEGWGRPHMEAMSCGVPVVATRWSGNLEFQDDDNSWLIDVEKLVPVGKEMVFDFYHGQKWAEPSLDSFVELLERSWTNSEERRAKGLKARGDMVKRWDWSLSARFVSERLAEILQGVPPKESHLQDPAWRDDLRARMLSGACGTAPAVFAQTDSIPPDHDGASSLSIRWEGSQFVHHSLALVNRELCAGLAKRGHDLSIIPFEPDQFGPGTDSDLRIIQQLTNAPLEGACQIHVRHQWPPNLTPPKEGRWIVAQPWEFGSPPKEWMPAFRDQVDELWAYTKYVRDMYVRAGVPEDRVHVVPLGVDCDKFRPGLASLPSLPEKRGVRFLYVGGSIARKGFDVLLDAWQKAFGPDDPVELLIKDMGGKTSYKGQTGERFVRQIQESGRFALIHYVNDDLAPSDLPALYASGDVLVHPYRGEGFGLPIAEAMACGLPVIVTAGGAADDFCGAAEAWKIPAERVVLPGGKVDRMETVEPAWWLEPSEEALVAALREAASDSVARRMKGEAARKRIAENFTWERSVERVQERLRAVAARPIRRFASIREKIGGDEGSLASLREQGGRFATEAVLEELSQLLFQVESMVFRQEFEEAERLTRHAVEAYPAQAMAWVSRAMVLRGLNKGGRALEALNKALEVGGGPEVRYEMLALHLQQGKEGPARTQWNILREKHPAWLEKQKTMHREQGLPWLPDRLKSASKGKGGAKAGKR